MDKFLLIFCFIAGFAAVALSQTIPKVMTPLVKVPSGSSISGHIIAGLAAQPGQFPWQAGLLITVGRSQYICGGVLVHAEWVLTAAHCTKGASKIVVRLGSIDYNNGGTAYTVTGTTNIITHASFSMRTLVNDVGLIKIPKITNSTTINPINILPTSVKTFTSNLTASGWGKTCDPNTLACDAGKFLNYVNLVPITNAECDQTYGTGTTVTSMICTKGYNGGKENICSGDSGGPLVQLNPNSKNYLVGVVSFGSSLGCEVKKPSGYSRANMFCDWMKTKTKITICV